jgi:hypothetical protein
MSSRILFLKGPHQVRVLPKRPERDTVSAAANDIARMDVG